MLVLPFTFCILPFAADRLKVSRICPKVCYGSFQSVMDQSVAGLSNSVPMVIYIYYYHYYHDDYHDYEYYLLFRKLYFIFRYFQFIFDFVLGGTQTKSLGKNWKTPGKPKAHRDQTGPVTGPVYWYTGMLMNGWVGWVIVWFKKSFPRFDSSIYAVFQRESHGNTENSIIQCSCFWNGSPRVALLRPTLIHVFFPFLSPIQQKSKQSPNNHKKKRFFEQKSASREREGETSSHVSRTSYWTGPNQTGPDWFTSVSVYYYTSILGQWTSNRYPLHQISLRFSCFLQGTAIEVFLSWITWAVMSRILPEGSSEFWLF